MSSTLSQSRSASQQVAGQPQRAAGDQGRRVFVESVVSQGQLAHLLGQFTAVPDRRRRAVGAVGAFSLQFRGLRAVAVIVQEEGQGGRAEAEVEAEQDEALQVAELLFGEGVAADGQELADPRGAHVHLSECTVQSRESTSLAQEKGSAGRTRQDAPTEPRPL